MSMIKEICAIIVKAHRTIIIIIKNQHYYLDKHEIMRSKSYRKVAANIIAVGRHVQKAEAEDVRGQQ